MIFGLMNHLPNGLHTLQWLRELDGIKYGSNAPAKLIISSAVKPKIVLLNGKAIRNFTFDSVKKQVSIQIQAGEGLIKVN